MVGGLTASPPSSSLCSRPRIASTIQQRCLVQSAVRVPVFSLNLKLNSNWSRKFSRTNLRCNSSSSNGGPGPGENESKTVLDAFFLGKAFAEALNERIESTVGEFLSTIGRLQAEQQKQVQEFQEEVLERAKKAKEQAAREAMTAQGLVQQPSETVSRVNGVAGKVSSATDSVTSEASSSASGPIVEAVKIDLDTLESSGED